MKIPAAYLAAALAVLTCGPAAAGSLRASDAWIRATPGTEVAAVYLTLTNTGNAPVTVTGVRSPLAGAAMIHETQLEGTSARMRPRAEVTVAPGAVVRFAPGGLHVMLHMLQHPLRVGEEVPLELLLKDGSALALTARVRPLEAQ